MNEDVKGKTCSSAFINNSKGYDNEVEYLRKQLQMVTQQLMEKNDIINTQKQKINQLERQLKERNEGNDYNRYNDMYEK
jgi:peptidoglycan hydrolase CwlO-like protein